MAKIERGFPGERFVVLPQPFLDLMSDNPLTGDLYIHSLGHIAHATHHHVSRPNGITSFLFLYCTAGAGEIEIGGECFPFTSNHYVILPAGVPYSYRTDNTNPWTLYWVLFKGSKSRIFAKSMDRPQNAKPTIYLRQDERTDLFERMYSTLCGDLTIEKVNYANIVFLHFIASFKYIGLFSEPESQTSSTFAEGMIGRVTHFMNDNVENNLTLAELAAFAGYSESYFYRRFVKETGYSPIDYFIHLKMNKAAIYLIKTSMSIAQIAAKLGYSSPDYFSRTFKRIIGITATEFRDQNFRL